MKIKVEILSGQQINEKKIKTWPVWEKEISRFNYTYEEDEECYIIEGEFTVETDEGNLDLKPGDFVTFMTGLKCTWDIKKPVKKYYNFI